MNRIFFWVFICQIPIDNPKKNVVIFSKVLSTGQGFPKETGIKKCISVLKENNVTAKIGKFKNLIFESLAVEEKEYLKTKEIILELTDKSNIIDLIGKTLPLIVNHNKYSDTTKFGNAHKPLQKKSLIFFEIVKATNLFFNSTYVENKENRPAVFKELICFNHFYPFSHDDVSEQDQYVKLFITGSYSCVFEEFYSGFFSEGKYLEIVTDYPCISYGYHPKYNTTYSVVLMEVKLEAP